MGVETGAIMAVAFGVDVEAAAMIRSALPNIQLTELPLNISGMLKSPVDFEPHLIFCGRPKDTISLIEVVQGIRSLYSTAPIYYATTERRGFDRKSLEKSGFTDAFLMPIDQSTIRDLVAEGSADFKNVPLVDITAETVLEFDTYLLLPINRKYIKFSSAGRPLEGARLKRLLDHQVSSIHINRSDLGKFYEFSAQQLAKIANTSGGSELERRERMQAAVRSLLTGFLTNTAEINDCSQIVHSYILSNVVGESSLFEKILRVGVSSGDSYTHVSNTSTIAALLAMALVPESTEQIALAGLLHDIGLADLPVEIQNLPATSRTREQNAIYERHPTRSIDLIAARNIQIPEMVLKIIEQHHESFDGQGFPNKLKGDQLLFEAQLLRFADEIDYLTAITLGQASLSLQQAAAKLLKSPNYKPEMLASVAQLFQI